METHREHNWYIENIAEFEQASSHGDFYCADFVYESVFRDDLEQAGYVHIRFAPEIGSRDLRRAMLVLAGQLSVRHPEPLTTRWALRFDQQITSRFHRDGGPDESYLLLGYEPSSVASEVFIADFSRAAAAENITPDAYLARYNLMIATDAERLSPYVTRLSGFDSRVPNLLVINNSASRLGVFHRAAVLVPLAGERRIINSVQIAPASLPGENLSPDDRKNFLVTEEISGP